MADSVLGVHLFAVDDTDAAVDEVKIPDVNLYIISISDGDTLNLQYGPIITKEDKQQLSKYFSNGVCPITLSRSSAWHILDLKRLCPDIEFTMVYEYDPWSRKDFDTARFYTSSMENRRASADLAKACITGALGVPDQGIQAKLRTITASAKWMAEYAQTVPILRLKWLEIQGMTKVLEDYKVEDDPIPSKRKAEDGDGTYALELTQSANGWESHLMEGTRLVITDVLGEEHEVVISKVKYRRVKFWSPTPKKDIIAMKIISGEEKLSDVRTHQVWSKRILFSIDVNDFKGGLQFVARDLALPEQTSLFASLT